MLTNGHVLHLYLSCEKRRVETERVLRSKFHDEHLPPILNGRIYGLVSKTVKNFKNVKDQRKFKQFSETCNETFNLAYTHVEGTAAEDVSVGSDAVDTPVNRGSGDLSPPAGAMPQPDRTQSHLPSTSFPDDALPCQKADSGLATSCLTMLHPADVMLQSDPSTSGMATRSASAKLTPREAQLKRRLQFTTKNKVKEAQAYKLKIKALRKQLKCHKCVLSQVLKHKAEQIKVRDVRIRELEEKLKETGLVKELKKAKAELAKLKKKNLKAKKHHKRKMKVQPATISLPPTSTSPTTTGGREG